VHVDAAVVRRQQRRHLALDRLQRGRRLARGEVVEQARDPVERRPARSSAPTVLAKLGGSLRCAMRVDLARWSRIAAAKAGGEVLGRDPGERRQAVFAGPGLQERVVVRGGGTRHFLRFRSFRSRSS
jgi:hypothetical protein